MSTPHVVVIGAGVGGLAAAIELAASGARVTVLESADEPGGKMRQLSVAGKGVDAGPTVFTMRWIFDGLLAQADTNLESILKFQQADVLARHAWRQGGELDLYASTDKSYAAIEASVETPGLRKISAGNYNGRLGKSFIYLHPERQGT